MHGTPSWFPHTQSSECGRLHGTEKRYLLTLPLLSRLPGFVKWQGLEKHLPREGLKRVTKMAEATLSGSVPKRSQGGGLWLWTGGGCANMSTQVWIPRTHKGDKKPDMVVHMEP